VHLLVVGIAAVIVLVGCQTPQEAFTSSQTALRPARTPSAICVAGRSRLPVHGRVRTRGTVGLALTAHSSGASSSGGMVLGSSSLRR
jgi:hypothetical protein